MNSAKTAKRAGARVAMGAAAGGLLVALLPYLGSGSGGGTGAVDLGGALWMSLPLLFLGGLLTSLTPCVYPLIPITVSIFGARGKASSRKRAAALSGTYVLGIASTYSVLGVAAAASGRAFGSFMGNPLVAGAFALVMLVFAASMFGLFEIRLPAALQGRLSKVAGLGFGSAFAMGLVAGVVAAPCTGPVMGAVLTYVAGTRDLMLGFWMMFAYAIGMGTLFFVLGTFSVSLPKGGAWMDGVKTVLGIALVLVAFSFVRPLLPRSPDAALSEHALAVAAGVLVAIAVAFGAIHRSFHGSAAEKTAKVLGVVVIVAAVSLRLGWAVRPAAPYAADGSAARIEWLHDEGEALARAKAEGKPVLIDFFAEWCAACKELDERTFRDPRVRELIATRFIALKHDGTDDSDEVRALHAKYGVVGLPLVTVVSADGRQLDSPKVAGFLAADAFLTEIRKALD